MTYLFFYHFQMPLVMAGCARKDFLCITFGCPLWHYQTWFRTPCHCISWTQWNRLSKVKTVNVYSYMKPCSSSVIDWESLIEFRSHKPVCPAGCRGSKHSFTHPHSWADCFKIMQFFTWNWVYTPNFDLKNQIFSFFSLNTALVYVWPWPSAV